jgi:hypothetical protein
MGRAGTRSLRIRRRGAGVSGAHHHAAVDAEHATPEALRAHLKQEIDTLNPMLIKAGITAN